MLTARTSDSRRAVSISRSCPACSAPMVGTNPIFFLDSRKSRASLTVWTVLTTWLPELPDKVVLGNFRKHRFIRVPQAVVNEAHVRAPALVASDPVRFARSGRCFPKDLQIHVHVAKVSDRLSEFACADAPVEVDHR